MFSYFPPLEGRVLWGSTQGMNVESVFWGDRWLKIYLPYSDLSLFFRNKCHFLRSTKFPVYIDVWNFKCTPISLSYSVKTVYNLPAVYLHMSAVIGTEPCMGTIGIVFWTLLKYVSVSAWFCPVNLSSGWVLNSSKDPKIQQPLWATCSVLHPHHHKKFVTSI